LVSVESLKDFSPNLTQLDISDNSFKEYSHSEKGFVREPPQNVNLAYLAKLANLQMAATNFRYVPFLNEQAVLTHLDLSDCSILYDLSNLIKLPKLQTLILIKCYKLPDLNGIDTLQELQNLDISFCNISNLEPLRKLKNLKNLIMRGCNQITDLTPISKLSELEKVDLSGIDTNIDMTPLSTLQNVNIIA
jgi:internalin A